MILFFKQPSLLQRQMLRSIPDEWENILFVSPLTGLFEDISTTSLFKGQMLEIFVNDLL